MLLAFFFSLPFLSRADHVPGPHGDVECYENVHVKMTPHHLFILSDENYAHPKECRSTCLAHDECHYFFWDGPTSRKCYLYGKNVRITRSNANMHDPRQVVKFVPVTEVDLAGQVVGPKHCPRFDCMYDKNISLRTMTDRYSFGGLLPATYSTGGEQTTLYCAAGYKGKVYLACTEETQGTYWVVDECEQMHTCRFDASGQYADGSTWRALHPYVKGVFPDSVTSERNRDDGTINHQHALTCDEDMDYVGDISLTCDEDRMRNHEGMYRVDVWCFSTCGPECRERRSTVVHFVLVLVCVLCVYVCGCYLWNARERFYRIKNHLLLPPSRNETTSVRNPALSLPMINDINLSEAAAPIDNEFMTDAARGAEPSPMQPTSCARVLAAAPV